MRRLAAALGVDYDQWLALTRVALKLDFRQMTLSRSRLGRETRGVLSLVMQAVFYSIYGLFMAILVWAAHDLLLASTILMTYVMFMVGTAVLLDHNSALTSPQDYGILGFRPVSSRTYFAARLSNALAYTTALTFLATYFPAASLFIRHGAAIGLAGLVAIYACSLSTAFAILFAYGWLMHAVGPDALKRALSYVQVAMSFVIYGGYFLTGQLARSLALTSTSLPRSAWILLAPPAWFGSYLDAAAGQATPVQFAAILLSAVVFGLLVAGLGGRLSMDYSDRLATLTSATARPSRARSAGTGRGWWFRRGEARAVAVLVRSQFRNDQRFRMAVLSILPLTLIYVIIGVRDGNLHDPFVAARGRSGFSLITVAVLLFPSMLKNALTRSDTFRASWIFFACPVDRLQVIRSAKNVVVAYFLVPYLLFVGAIYSYIVRDPLHVLVHMTLLGLISHLVLQAMVLLDPELPFSRPTDVGRRSTAVIFLMMVMGLVSGLLQAFSPLLYASLEATAAVFVTIAAATVVIDLLTRARVDRQARSLEFQG